MLWLDREYDLPAEYPLGAARGCLYGTAMGVALWSLLFALGYALAAIRYP